MILLLVFLFILMRSSSCDGDSCFLRQQRSREISEASMEDIIQLSDFLRTKSNLRLIFKKINLVRPVGSSNHALVRQFIKESLSKLQWNVEETPFSAETVIGQKHFVNVIGTQNVTKSRRLVLACHYDSLQKDGFLGSMDSAIPCALMLSIAEILTPFLKKNSDLNVSLQMIFFDGEEAFIKWTDSDSLYGSRYLSALWADTRISSSCSRLNIIDTMVLLDLLGASNPKFYFFTSGNLQLYRSLVNIESAIENQQDIFQDLNHPYFSTMSVSQNVQDDHIPFMKRGVPIVHLIPVPFPPQWHTNDDNANNIDWNSSNDLELILSVFVVQYFNLGPALASLLTDDS